MTGLCDRDGWFNAVLLCAGFEQETTTLPSTQNRLFVADIQMTSWCLVVLEAGECLGVVILGVESLEPEQRHTPFSGVMHGSWEDPALTTVCGYRERLHSAGHKSQPTRRFTFCGCVGKPTLLSPGSVFRAPVPVALLLVFRSNV